MNEDIRTRLDALVKKLSRKLLLLQGGCPSEHLIAPRIGEQEVRRISEQEVRVVLCQMLDAEADWFYSVETPTEKKESQTGKTARSALFDLSLYADSTKNSKFLNIEFKMQNPDPEFIAKDVRKMLRDTRDGLWFHVLNKVDDNSYKKLFRKCSDLTVPLDAALGPERTILFSFCVLAKRRLFRNQMVADGSKPKFNKEIERLFSDHHNMLEGKEGWTGDVL